MLGTLKNLFDAFLPPPATAGSMPDTQHRLHLAAAVLLVEVMRADAQLDATERDAMRAALQARFAVPDATVQQLIDQAQQACDRASDYFAFTSRINDGFTMAEKVQLIEHMWRVAYADGTLSAHENHLMRRISDLLHVPHGAYVHAKMRARPVADAG